MIRQHLSARFAGIAWLVLGLAAILSGCRADSNEPAPPKILYGQDLCAQCGMVIDEPRFAAASILTNGDVLKFDDVGEMLIYHMNHPEKQAQDWFAHDYNSEQWMRGEIAHYVIAETLQTPMGTGIVAFKDLEQAKKFALEMNARVFTFDEIRAKVHMDVHGASGYKITF